MLMVVWELRKIARGKIAWRSAGHMARDDTPYITDDFPMAIHSRRAPPATGRAPAQPPHINSLNRSRARVLNNYSHNIIVTINHLFRDIVHQTHLLKT